MQTIQFVSVSTYKMYVDVFYPLRGFAFPLCGQAIRVRVGCIWRNLCYLFYRSGEIEEFYRIEP